MGFSDKQIKALERGLSRRNIRARVSDGKQFSYIEGWFAIAEANRIFGFDGWDRETLEAKCVQAREVRGSHAVVYTVRVRVSVRSAERVTIREGFGTGEARGALLGEAHDLALKAAETDATKRALVTFGKAFGLALHSYRTRRAVPHQAHPVHARENSAAPAPVNIDQPAGPIGPPCQLNRSPPALHDGADSANGAKLRSAVDKSRLLLSEPRRVRDKKHLRFVASQPCVVCKRVPTDAHHIRYAQPKALGAKVSDEFSVPLCREHHRELHHTGNERAWWHEVGLDPLPVAKELWQRGLEMED